MTDVSDEWRDNFKRYWSPGSGPSRWQKLLDEGNWMRLAPVEERILERLPMRSGICLDIGCGFGREAAGLAGRGFRVVAVELLPHVALKAAWNLRQAEDQVSVVAADMRALPFGGSAFDLIFISAGALQYVPGRSARKRVLRDLARLSRPEGRLVIHVFNPVPRVMGCWVGPSVLSRAGNVLSAVLFWTLGAAVSMARRLVGGRIEPWDARVPKVGLYHFYWPWELEEDLRAAGWAVEVAQPTEEFLGAPRDQLFLRLQRHHWYFICAPGLQSAQEIGSRHSLTSASPGPRVARS